MLITQNEIVITEAFKELHPWKGSAQEITDKWQNYLNNLCVINGVKVIPNLLFPENTIQKMTMKSYHSVSPPVIFLKSLSVQDLLYHFHNYKSEINYENDSVNSVEYAVGLFCSVWPKKIAEFNPCPSNENFKYIINGLNSAMEYNSEFKQNINVCKEHKPKKYLPSQRHPEWN